MGQCDVPAGARHIRLDGMTLLPGLIDMHVHLDSDPAYGGYTSLQFNDRFLSVLGVVHARRTLDAGFTTVRNLGADAWNDVGLRQAIDGGKITGPRIVTAGYAIGTTGGHCDKTYFPPSMQQKGEYNFDSPDEARKRVREVRKYGAQVIKICATGGVFSLNTEPGAQQASLAEMRAIVEEGIALAKRHGAWLSMDIYDSEYFQAEGTKNGTLEENLRKDREIAQVQRDNFQRAHRAGVKMVYGTDAGVYPHGQNARQFGWMVKYGMTPLEAVKGDPLADVAVLEDVAVVIKGGEVVKDLAAAAPRPLR